MQITTVLLGISMVLNIILAGIVVFLERRNISATWAWLMVLFFLPVLGFILYIIFGQNLSRRRIFKWDKHEHTFLQRAVFAQMKLIEENRSEFRNPVIHNYNDLIFLHLNNNEALYTENNALQIFTDGHEKFESLLYDIQNAQEHIHLIYYIIRDDELGKRIASTLAEKARQGVEVRVLYDDSGSRHLSRRFKKQIEQSGGIIEAFFPGKIPMINLRVNYRNHRKIAIIDSKIGYIGGFNIGNEYLGLNQRFGYWRDTHLRIEGEAVNNLQSRFMLDWNQASKMKISFKEYYYPTLEIHGEIGIQIVSSGPDSEWEQIKHGYIKMILSAKKYVYIQTPYLIPDESLLDALKIAAFSGVDVQIMIPNKPDHPFVYWATYSNAGQLLRAGVKIFTYENGFLHAKMIVVDGKIASVGTANIDVRSFRLNFEVNAFLYHPDIAQQLAEIFKIDIRLSSELTIEKYQKRSILIQTKESISRLLSPIL
ncbi:cardiolipin synthase [Bacillus sp. T3]|uniref:cardiolipin synthase n=1 Tax=Bacillus sp. T3 TaxID=467262 RepID=UPI0029823BBE|nr:cardiolipin synthase [Bacillus sp. T3]